MKNILLVISIYSIFLLPDRCYAQIPVCTTDVYLQAAPLRHMKIVYWGSQKYIAYTACCAAMKGDLVIQVDSANGVIIDPVNGNGMFMPNYLTASLINGCDPSISVTAIKDVAWLSSREKFPYSVNQFGAVAITDYDEWPYLLQYGVPDVNITFGYLRECVLYTDYSICVTEGWRDCYYNYINITGLPDGVYVFEATIQLPPSVFDLGRYPQQQSLLIRMAGDSLEFDVSGPGCCTFASITSPQDVILKGKKLSWQPSPDAENYNVYRQVGYNVQGTIVPNANYSPVLITNTPSTTINIPQMPGNIKYAYLVSAVNCYGESEMVAP